MPKLEGEESFFNCLSPALRTPAEGQGTGPGESGTETFHQGQIDAR